MDRGRPDLRATGQIIMRLKLLKTAWHGQLRDWLIQAGVILALLLALAYLYGMLSTNLQAKNISSGFDFLFKPASFGIGEGVYDFEAGSPYWQAFAAGLANTLRVALLAILLSTLLGLALGFGRLSRNILLRGLCTAYVEIFRNIPLLLQLLAWYFLLTTMLPEDARQFFGHCYLSKSGLSFPVPLWGSLAWDIPSRTPYSIAGGARLTPEFLTMLCGLTIYTAAYLAENIRAGLESVPAGQAEAGAALGLTHPQILRRILLPQALRVIIPPATNQFSSLIKSSSLAITVGYPDLVSIANTSLILTGHAAECISLIIGTYLLLSLLLSIAMNWLNRRVQIKER